ncbi:helix-turn-helix domain-containing protein [Streptomyces iconiensis]|uniref:helix-turn-helix domain-containing protein n=1 Tax=Streptomyces iconiensis TaxID=1384038 RepID=UPI003D2F841A
MTLVDLPGSGRRVISRVLRNARSRRDPRATPSFESLLGPRAERGLSQEDVALLCGVSERWYRRLESGEPRNYFDAFLSAVCRVLDLSEGEWDLVSSLSRNHAAPRATPGESTPWTKHPAPGPLLRVRCVSERPAGHTRPHTSVPSASS